MRELILRQAAEAEVEEAYNWYDAQRLGLGAEFLQVFEAGLAAIQRSPEAFPQKYYQARQLILRRFPYSIFFIIQPDESIEVLSCFHVRRDPRRWLSRVRGGT